LDIFDKDRLVLIKVIHDDGKICEFVEYASVSSFLMERDRKKKDPKMMKDKRDELHVTGQENINNSTSRLTRLCRKHSFEPVKAF
jgi:hypothetical protein